VTASSALLPAHVSSGMELGFYLPERHAYDDAIVDEVTRVMEYQSQWELMRDDRWVRAAAEVRTWESSRPVEMSVCGWDAVCVSSASRASALATNTAKMWTMHAIRIGTGAALACPGSTHATWPKVRPWFAPQTAAPPGRHVP
jgi:hypothetical protein